MPRFVHLLVIALSFVALGCAAATPRVEAQAKKEMPLSAYILPDAQVVLHLRAEALRGSPLAAALEEAARAIAPEAAGPFAVMTERCGLGWDDIDELVLSGRLDREELVAVATSRDPERLLGCLRKEDDETAPLRIGAREGLSLGGEEVVVIDGRRLVAGREERVREVLKAPPARAGAQDVIARLEGSDESLCRLYLLLPERGEASAMSLALGGDDAELNVTVSLDMPTTEAADRTADFLSGVLQGARGYLRASTDGARAEQIARALRHVEVRRRVGGRVSVQLDVVGRPERQADALRGFLTMAQGTLAVMHRRARVAEARAIVIDLAERLATHADANRRGYFKLPSFPAGAPAVPSAVPSGAPIEVSAADWSHPTWRALAFHREGAAHHSFSIELSRDKRVATVRAVADLDGDGRPSTLSLAVRISPRGEIAIDREMGLENELE